MSPDQEIQNLIKRSLGQKSDFCETGICTAMLIEAQVSCIYYAGEGMVCEYYEYETRKCLRGSE